MSKRKIVTIWIALMIGSAFATSALAVGSDVVRPDAWRLFERRDEGEGAL
jgi:hypothetical protein